MTNDDRRLTEVIGSLIDDIRLLLRDQVALAQAEVRRSVQAGVTALILVVAAGLLLALAALFALFAATEGLIAAGMSRWAAYLIVAVIFALIGGVLVGAAVRRTRAIGMSRTTASIAQARATVAEAFPSLAPESGSENADRAPDSTTP